MDERMIQVIDSRIERARRSWSDRGTVISRDATGVGATVTFDADGVASPVKCAGNVLCRPGDRVVLTRHGSVWVIVGMLGQTGLGEAYSKVTFGGANTAHNSTSFADLSGFTAFSFTKLYDTTSVWVSQKWMGYPSATVTGAEYGVRFVQQAGDTPYSAVDIPIGRCFVNASGIHTTSTDIDQVTTLPAGVYLVSYRIRRYVGTGTLTCDQNDQVWIRCDERDRAGALGS